MNQLITPAIVYFDGVCNLCNSSVQFVLKNDKQALFTFASLQSEAGKKLQAECERKGIKLPDSLVLKQNGNIYTESAAALKIAAKLRFPINILSFLIVIPKPLRDWIYRLIAKNRYSWFGKKETCMIPTPELKHRFIAD